MSDHKLDDLNNGYDHKTKTDSYKVLNYTYVSKSERICEERNFANECCRKE